MTLSPVQAYLTVTPPGPVTDGIELDIRWTVAAEDAPARDVTVTVLHDGAPLGAEETIDLAAGDITGRQLRISTAGWQGVHTFSLSVRVAGVPLPIVSRTVTVLLSPCRSTRLLGGAWVGLTHWSEDEARYWNAELSRFTEADWRGMVRDMQAIGLHTIIIQETWRNPVWYGRHYHQMTAENYRETYAGKAYYPSRLWPARVELPCADPVEAILDEADRLGMRVFLGVGMYAHFDYTAGSLAWHRDVLRELWDRYRHHDALHGWYVSEELAGPIRPHEHRYWDATDEFRAEVLAFFTGLQEIIRSLAPHTLLMVAPDADVDDAADVWPELLRQCDIACFQVYQQQSPEAIARMQAWCDAAGCHHWLDLEIFGFEHPDKPGIHREGYTERLPDGTEQWIPTPLVPQPLELLRKEMEQLHTLEYICAYQYPGLLCAPDARLKPGGERAVQLYRVYQAYCEQALGCEINEVPEGGHTHEHR